MNLPKLGPCFIHIENVSAKWMNIWKINSNLEAQTVYKPTLNFEINVMISFFLWPFHYPYERQGTSKITMKFLDNNWLFPTCFLCEYPVLEVSIPQCNLSPSHSVPLGRGAASNKEQHTENTKFPKHFWTENREPNHWKKFMAFFIKI